MNSIVLSVVTILCFIYMHCTLAETSSPIYEIVKKSTPTPSTLEAELELKSGSGPYGNDVKKLHLLIKTETLTRAHIKITDSSKSRWEPPSNYLNSNPQDPGVPLSDCLIGFSVAHSPFSLTAYRALTDKRLFDTIGLNFVFSDQYLSLQTRFDTGKDGKLRLYGAAERFADFQLKTDNHRFTMWNKDNYLAYDQNLYGTHPFLIQHVPETGQFHGIFLFNSNAQDIIVNKDTAEFRTIGGILDFFIFYGDTYDAVVRQYHELIGPPLLPAYWTMGFHQCRYGYKNINETRDVARKYRQYQIPMDTMWSDIDYMNEKRMFTWDPVNYPVDQVRAFAHELADNNQKYVVILDPGVKVEKNYEPYESLLKSGAYIKRADGKGPIVNKVWPGYTIFPDFSNPNVEEYWYKHISAFLDTVDGLISGLWIDMNEVAGFCTGECYPQNYTYGPQKQPDIPTPYIPGGVPLNEKTLRLDSITHGGLNYDVHNLYGLQESNMTKRALERKTNKRSFVLSRSTFPHSGTLASMWLGDNQSGWDDLRYSISGVLTMNIMGVSMVGGDIGGFVGNTTRELMSRWIAVGALSPFSRNHNDIESKPQEPWVLDLVDVFRKHLLNRYSLLPYFYTLFYNAHKSGGTIWNPVFALFPKDFVVADLGESQFFVGHELMVTPVLKEGAREVETYFPARSVWYDYFTGQLIREYSDFSKSITFPCALEDIVIHQLGGTALVRQQPATTTPAQRNNSYFLQIASDHESLAKSTVYFDDGESLSVGKEFAHFRIVKSRSQLTIRAIEETDYSKTFSGRISEFIFYGGIPHDVSLVRVNGEQWGNFARLSDSVFVIKGLNLPFSDATIEWM